VSRVAFKSIDLFFYLVCAFVFATCFFCSVGLVKECNICRFLNDGYFFISTPLPFDFSVLEDVCNFSRSQDIGILASFCIQNDDDTRRVEQEQLDTCSKA
jgi:hypothetical protein